MKFYVTNKNQIFLLFKCPEKGKFVSPDTGDEFRVDDVVAGSEELFTLSLCNAVILRLRKRVWLVIGKLKRCPKVMICCPL